MFVITFNLQLKNNILNTNTILYKYLERVWTDPLMQISLLDKHHFNKLSLYLTRNKKIIIIYFEILFIFIHK
jgi:hypothetical protein